MPSPQTVRDYLRTKLAEREHEVFVTLLLVSQNRLIEYIELFRARLRKRVSIHARSALQAVALLY